MTKEEFGGEISFLFNTPSPIGITVYLVLDEGEEQAIRFANISAEVATDLKKLFIDFAKAKFVNNAELEYCSISESDDRSNTVYEYDLEDHPSLLQPLYDVHAYEEMPLTERDGRFPNFSFIHEDVEKIRAFVICIGNETNRVTLYKKHHPFSLLTWGSYIGIFPDRNQLAKFTKDLIKINGSFEFMLVQETLVVLSIKTFQNSFGYDQIIRRKATSNIELIRNLELLEEVTGLIELAAELKYAKRLMRLKHDSPVLLVPFPSLKTFIQGHPKLKRRIKFNEESTRINLHTRSSKELFIKILNDDYLKSELTQLLYDSQIKNAMDNVEEED